MNHVQINDMTHEAVSSSHQHRTMPPPLANGSSFRPLPIISITGAMRKGKSFLLNFLSQNQNLFAVSNRGACTTGMKLGISHMQPQMQERIQSWLDDDQDTHGDKGSSGNNLTQSMTPSVLECPQKWCLIDVEGQGDIHINRDRDLMLSTLLLSTVLLYNIQGYAPREEILRMLDLVVRTYEIMERNGMSGHQLGNSSLLKDSSSSGKGVKFGHLNIVIRDYQHSLTQEEVWRELFEMEAVVEGKANSADTIQPDSTHHQHIVERNRIRSKLRKYFSGLHVWLLPQPTIDSSLLAQQESLHFSQVSAQFHFAVSQMMHSITDQIGTFLVHSRGGNPFHLNSAQEIEAFLKEIFSMLSHDNLRMTSLVSMLEEKDAEQSVSLLAENFQRQIDKDVLPMLDVEKRLDTLKRQFSMRLEYLLGDESEEKGSMHSRWQSSPQSDTILSRALRQFHKQIATISLMQIHKNNMQKTRHISRLIDSLCKEALQMMDASSPLTFHDDFEEIQQKLEDKLMDDAFVAELSATDQEEERKNLRWRLEPYKEIFDVNERANNADNEVGAEDGVSTQGSSSSIHPPTLHLTALRTKVLKDKQNLTTKLPLHPRKLDAHLKELNVQLNVNAQKLLNQKKATSEQLSELYPLVEDMEMDLRQLNELFISRQTQTELERIRETTLKMLAQYDIFQFTEVDAFQVQLTCFLDDILSKGMQPQVFSLLTEEQQTELRKRIDTMCREMYDYEADRNRNINAQAYARMLDLVSEKVESFEDQLQQERDTLLPCNEKVLELSFDTLLSKSQREMREAILKSAVQAKPSLGDQDQGGQGFSGGLNVSIHSSSSLESETSSKHNQKMEVVLTPQQLDQLVDRFTGEARRLYAPLLKENTTQSESVAQRFFNTTFKDNVESLFVSLFSDHKHEPNNEEISDLCNDCVDNFWSYSPANGKPSLRNLPLSHLTDEYKNKIRADIASLCERFKKDKEWAVLKKNSSVNEYNSKELLSVNRFLVEKIQGMKKELERMHILKKENEALREKLEGYLQKVEDKDDTPLRDDTTNSSSSPNPSSITTNTPPYATEPPQHNFVHLNTSCAACGARPIVGLRFQSSFDKLTNFCERCFLSRKLPNGVSSARESQEYHRVYVNNDQYLPNVELLIQRLDEMGFSGEAYFESIRGMIHKLVEHKGDFKSLIPHLMKKKGVNLPIFEKGSDEEQRKETVKSAPSHQTDEYLQKRMLLKDMGHTDDELNRELLQTHKGNLTAVARFLAGK